jgi:hypothetical protein
MYGIGHHGGTVPHDTGNELEGKQQHVHRTSDQCNPVYLTVPFFHENMILRTNLPFYYQIRAGKSEKVLYLLPEKESFH